MIIVAFLDVFFFFFFSLQPMRFLLPSFVEVVVVVGVVAGVSEPLHRYRMVS